MEAVEESLMRWRMEAVEAKGRPGLTSIRWRVFAPVSRHCKDFV